MNTDGLNTYRPRVLPMSALLNTEEYVVKPATSPHIGTHQHDTKLFKLQNRTEAGIM